MIDRPNKRFRTDFNNSFTNTQNSARPMRSYEINHQNYGQHPEFYNHRLSAYPYDLSREDAFERVNLQLQAYASDNHGHDKNRSSHYVSKRSNYHNEHHLTRNDNNGRYDNRQTNYNPDLTHSIAKVYVNFSTFFLLYSSLN